MHTFPDYPARNSQCVLKKKTKQNLSPSPLAQQPDLPLAFPVSKNDNIFMGVCLSLTLRILLALFLCHMPFHSQPVPKPHTLFSSVQFSSVTQSCPTLCDPMNRSTPGLPVHHQLPEFTQTHVHPVGDAIQPPHPLLSPSPPAPNPSQHQGLFQ